MSPAPSHPLSASAEPRPELVVIGSGIIGLCTCYYLLTSDDLPLNARVTLVENSRSQTIAHGASSNAGGFVAGGNPDSAWFGSTTSSLGELSYRCHQELAQSRIGEWGYRETSATGLTVGHGDQSRSAYRTLPKGTSETVEHDWLDGQREDVGAQGGIAQLDPRQFCAEMYKHLSKNPNFRTCFGNSTSFKRSTSAAQGELQLTQDKKSFSIPVSKLVICAGPWSSILCSTLQLPKLHLINLPGHSLLIRPSPGSPISAEAVFAGINGAEVGIQAATSGLARDLTPEEVAQGFTKAPELFTRTCGAIYIAGENSMPSTVAEQVGIEPSAQDGPNKLPANVDDVEKLKDDKLVVRLKIGAALASARLDEAKGAIIEKENKRLTSV
ncbi:BZ3500_MvSof-1268-A1-R1_Chr5-2g08065 [Microbotryum saponariae]|uniref:BZ3500_MvSof-1268-A1-R1_Chr5-2g08065 protein n=1 Tax=Microbotryum saponariae TaxID=289078 RepID=A0A2X0KIW2_9BASI|nr:BZ3500_MvSof-1268-A1-R1_Chr5-2g08065 [Microbotryum saponariae]SDA05934.1 BZ3501_MvSof-1269-A2-R1_Chr5-2g07887 [Microbotryum saponariae]